MKRVAFAVAFLVIGGSALAAESTAPPKPMCEDFAKLKAEFAKDKDLAATKFTPLTAGQFHFMVGFYAASPLTPRGLPPGDGAQLIQFKDKASIVWTRGKTVCMSLIATGERDESGAPKVAYMPLPLTADLVKMLETVKTGADETLSKDDGEELHL